MDRRDFLSGCFGGCLMVAGLGSCSKDTERPAEGEVITVDLNTDLLVPGSFVRIKNLLIIRFAEGNLATNFAAMEGICPHAGGELEWANTENRVVCPVHGSRFSPQGSLVNGPAASNLRLFNISVAGNLLEIKVN
jgi:Rieske Fe-S protein